jgi:hypothetical protein
MGYDLEVRKEIKDGKVLDIRENTERLFAHFSYKRR